MLLDTKDIILKVIEKYVRDNVHTALPAKIINVKDYQGKQTVDCQVMVSRLYSNGDVLPYKDTTLYGVPVVMPSSGGGMLSFPVQKGDTVLLVFGMRSMDSWKLSDGAKEVVPTDSRHYAETDAIAIPGLYTVSSHLSPNPIDVELKFKECSFRYSPDNLITLTNGKATTTYESTGTVKTDNGSISSTLNSDGSGEVTNGTGSIKLLADGSVDINGVVISTTGDVTVPLGVTASTVSAPTISAGTSLTVNGVEQKEHKHGPGTYIDAENRPITGDSGVPK